MGILSDPRVVLGRVCLGYMQKLCLLQKDFRVDFGFEELMEGATLGSLRVAPLHSLALVLRTVVLYLLHVYPPFASSSGFMGLGSGLCQVVPISTFKRLHSTKE